MKALSLRQPWAHAVVFGGKTIENRVKWRTSNFRGPLLLHAAQGMTKQEWEAAKAFCVDRGLWDPIKPPFPHHMLTLARGAIIGVCDVIGVVEPRMRHEKNQLGLYNWVPDGTACVSIGARAGEGCRSLTPAEAKWWMGGFALVLANVRPLTPTPCKGALGFFKVPPQVIEKLKGEIGETVLARWRANAEAASN